LELGVDFERPWETHRAARADLTQRLVGLERPALTNYISTVADVSECLAQSEVLFREAERCEALGVYPGRAQDARDAARRYNEMARTILTEDAPAAVNALREDLRTPEAPDTTEIFSIGNRTIREGLAEWPLDVYEAREADEIISRGFELGRAGPDAMCDSAIDALQRLDHLRTERDQHNAAGLATLGALCLLGFVALMIYCAAPGDPTCTDPTVMLWAHILLIGGGVMLFFGVLSILASAAAA